MGSMRIAAAVFVTAALIASAPAGLAGQKAKPGSAITGTLGTMSIRGQVTTGGKITTGGFAELTTQQCKDKGCAIVGDRNCPLVEQGGQVIHVKCVCNDDRGSWCIDEAVQ